MENYSFTRNTNSVSIGIVVPNYNHGKFIATCINSIICQNVAVDELIVVDDCSIDDSFELIKNLIADVQYARVVRNKKNLGVYGAINTGADLLNTDYVMFVASNDFLLPGCIGHAKKSLIRHPNVGLWSATGNMVDEEGKFIKPIPIAIPSIFESYFSPNKSTLMAHKLGNWFAGPSVIYHKMTWESLGRFNPRYQGFSDLICALMVASLKGAIFVPTRYVGLRIHKNNFLSTTLRDPNIIIKVMEEVQNSASVVCPSLFDDEFTYLTLRRLVFSAIRANSGLNLINYSKILKRREIILLNFIDFIFSNSLRITRVICAFIVLRPFDIWPSIKNRYFLKYWREVIR